MPLQPHPSAPTVNAHSGPLLDRIDLHIEVPSVEYREISSKPSGRTIRRDSPSVSAKRASVSKRASSEKKTTCNARMSARAIKQHCKLSDESQELIRVAMTELNLSARAYDRI